MLSSDGNLTTNPLKIMKEIEKFYSDLYSADDDTAYDNHPFLQGAEIPKLSYDMRNICEGRLSVKECFDCLQSFENNKSPGNDGLTVEFYKKNFGILLEIYLLSLLIIHTNVVNYQIPKNKQ